jgi:hypothetical protein
MMEKYDDTYDQALNRLASLRLLLICGPSITSSVILQASLLTAINCGKRAFLGGVTVVLPELTITHYTTLPGGESLATAIKYYGGSIILNRPKEFEGFILTLGLPAESHEYSLEIVCNSWQGGVLPSGHFAMLPANDQLCLGATAAAAIGVGLAFLKLSGIDPRCADVPIGISLYRPDLSWLHEEASGCEVAWLPEKLWVLGLGHLGQAYLWNFALLPFAERSKVRLMLQDYDIVASANQSAGILTNSQNVGQQKTTVTREWLAHAGLKSLVTERKFNEYLKREGSEPFIAVCGFDNFSKMPVSI